VIISFSRTQICGINYHRTCTLSMYGLLAFSVQSDIVEVNGRSQRENSSETPWVLFLSYRHMQLQTCVPYYSLRFNPMLRNQKSSNHRACCSVSLYVNSREHVNSSSFSKTHSRHRSFLCFVIVYLLKRLFGDISYEFAKSMFILFNFASMRNCKVKTELSFVPVTIETAGVA
jgi:hypothetical protein